MNIWALERIVEPRGSSSRWRRKRETACERHDRERASKHIVVTDPSGTLTPCSQSLLYIFLRSLFTPVLPRGIPPITSGVTSSYLLHFSCVVHWFHIFVRSSRRIFFSLFRIICHVLSSWRIANFSSATRLFKVYWFHLHLLLFFLFFSSFPFDR